MKKERITLETISKEPIFTVQETYFEELQGSIMKRCREQKAPVRQPILGSLTSTFRLSLASIILIFAFIGIFWSNRYKPDFTFDENFLEGISNQEVTSYLLQSERLERADLALVRLSEKEVSGMFLKATPEEIEEVVDIRAIEEYYY